MSQAIDPRGQVHERLAAMEEGTLLATMRRETELTFYTRVGWLVPWFVFEAALAGWGTVLFLKKIPVTGGKSVV